MNDDHKQPQSLADELGAFERQLRSLTPRDADFQLSAIGSSQPQAFAIHPHDSSARSKNKSWVVALIGTWSLGAAAGIAGTLVYINLGKSLFGSNTAEVSGGDLKNQAPVIAKVSESQVRESPSTDIGQDENRYRFAEAPSSLPNPWSFWAESSVRSSAQSTLTPRNFTTDLAFDSPSGSRKYSSDEMEGHRSEIPDAVLNAPQEGTQKPKPINQRDLMKDLLQI